MLGKALYAGAVCLVLLGLYGMVVPRNLMRIVLGLVLLESGVNLFLVAAGFRADAAAPILTAPFTAQAAGPLVDPVPQALVLTAIVIGVGVLALGLALVVRVKEAYGTLDTHAVANRMARETGADPAVTAAGARTPGALPVAAGRTAEDAP
ncbi:MAG: cation:proton antiporter subunit C [Hyphomicrobiales bacterium]|nr:cation:proton antiporter subunit C [Hyphomicrobiales bacterium]MCP5371297.1 cation:proton antiporter subunit C [Hyphomicrobiales bacterium]